MLCYTHFKTCLATNQVVAESREQFYFVQKNLQNVARFTGPRQTCISASDQTSLYGVIPQKL